MLNLNKVHQYERVPGTQMEVRLVRTDPYLRLTHGADPPVYVQGGAVYSEGGPVVDELPGWFAGEMAKASPKVRAEVGWGGGTPEAPAPAPSIHVVKPPAMWNCPECHETMVAKKKGFHVAHHRRAARQVVPAGTV